MVKKKAVQKPMKQPVSVVPTDYKILQELKNMNDTLREMRDILDNTWRERRPRYET